jgi:hypothetical protein
MARKPDITRGHSTWLSVSNAEAQHFLNLEQQRRHTGSLSHAVVMTFNQSRHEWPLDTPVNPAPCRARAFGRSWLQALAPSRISLQSPRASGCRFCFGDVDLAKDL